MSVSPFLYSHTHPLILLTIPLSTLPSFPLSHLWSSSHISSISPTSTHCRILILALYYVVCILALLADQLTWIGNVSISKGAAVPLYILFTVLYILTLLNICPVSLSISIYLSLSLSPSFSLPFLLSYPFSLPLVPLLSFCLSPLSVFLSISISPFLSFSLFSAPSLFLSLHIYIYIILPFFFRRHWHYGFFYWTAYCVRFSLVHYLKSQISRSYSQHRFQHRSVRTKASS